MTWSRPGVQLLAAVVVSASSCAEPAQTGVDASICAPLTFRACDTPAGRGVQQCFDDGTDWSECEFVLLDAHLGEEVRLDGTLDTVDGADAPLDGAVEALDVPDARLDGDSGTVERSLAPDSGAEGELEADSGDGNALDGPRAD